MNEMPLVLVAFVVLMIFGFKGLLFIALVLLIFKFIDKKGLTTWNDILTSFNNASGRIYRSNSNEKNYSIPIFNNHNIMKKIIFTIVIFIALLIVLDGFVSIPAGSTGVIFNRFGGGIDLKNTYGEGIGFKIPFAQSVVVMNTRMQTYTMSIAPLEGEIAGDDSIEALTKDGQKIKIDVTIQYHLERGYAPVVYQKIGLDYENKIIRPTTRSAIREIVTGFASKDLFQEETRHEIQVQIESTISKAIEKENIQIDAVMLRNVSFSENYLNSIEEKQIAEQKIQKAEYEKQEAVKVKERKIIEAEAEAGAIKLKGEALRQNKEVIQLEMINKLSPNIKWGVLPDQVMPLLNLNEISQ